MVIENPMHFAVKDIKVVSSQVYGERQGLNVIGNFISKPNPALSADCQPVRDGTNREH